MKSFFDLALPIKLVVGAILGIIAGPGLIGLISEYATYVYAIRIGIRPPLEGIPYLNATVGVGSLMLVITASALFILVRTIVYRLMLRITSSITDTQNIINIFSFSFKKFFKFKAQTLETLRLTETIKNLNFREILLVSLPTAIICGLLVYSVSLLQASRVLQLFSEHSVFSENYALVNGFFCAIVVFIVMLTIWSEKAIWWIASLSGVSFYIACFTFMFSLSLYSDFLRLVGYGGGAEVVVTQRVGTSDVMENSYHLLLRTTDSLICIDNSNQQIVEIPINKVQSIKYSLTQKNYLNVESLGSS